MSSTTVGQLREAVNEIDSMSQSAFGEIATFARLSLGLLETPIAFKNPEALVCLLESIWGKARDAENHINCVASGVACSHVDQRRVRRIAAWRSNSDVDPQETIDGRAS